MNRLRIPFRILAVLIVTAIAWGLRARAVNLLPIDYDEDDYLRAGQEFAHLIRTSDWRGFLDTNYRPEHPPLAKIIIGVSILSAPEKPLTPDAPTTAGPNQYLPRDLVKPARTVNAVFGILTVFFLSLVNPLGGLMLAAHTFTIKYVSQIMLEAFPALTSLLMVMSYLQWKKGKRSGLNGWLILSSFFFGLTAASKYLYCVVGIAVLVDWYLAAKQDASLKSFLRNTLIWSALAVVIFFAFDPYLWPDPIGRLKESILYHAAYSSGASEVQSANFPLWQPFVWLTMSPAIWHDGVFPVAPDLFITIFAAFGLARLWKKERVYVLWLGLALFFLLFWPTKWPQYIVTLTAPLSLAAAEGIMAMWESIVLWWKGRKNKLAVQYKKVEIRNVIPWLVPGLIAFALLTLLPLLFQFAVSLTDFNTASIRDGFQGGIWRAVWGGITGQIRAMPLSFSDRSNKVQYTGLGSYFPVLNFLANDGVLVFNVLWTILSVLLQTGLGLGIALLLWQRGVRFGKFWQAMFILPWAIPEMIGALMWLNIFQPESGWLALAVKSYGPNIPFGFFAGWENTPNLWLIVFLIPAMWYGFPFMMLASSAGLKMIPAEVFDAAAIDGANIWQTLRY
ncbi:MAG: ABC transporter permease subunit, partial [Chloroflexi bacterium]|nr:ABC transporter permease subunit [Chloroflexota bacterium]